MGATERKEKEKLMRRNDIIDAAEKVIFSKGFDLATMDDIAKEAEFSKRTLYMYFNCKDQLYFEIMIRGYRILIHMIEAAMQDVQVQNSIERIKKLGMILYDFNAKYPSYFKAIMSYENGEKDFVAGIPDASREECYALGEKIFSCLTSEITRGVKEGSIRKELDVINTAIVLWSSILGVFYTLTNKKNYIERFHNRKTEELILEGLDFLIEAVKNPGGVNKNEHWK